VTIRTKYLATKSKESMDNNRILLSIGSDGAISFFHMKDAKAILLYPDQAKAMLRFIGDVCLCPKPDANKFGMDNGCGICGKTILFNTSNCKEQTKESE
jgi:hypothetical protein